MLGLNPSDQALLDIPNKIGREDGLIYYPDFCQLCLEYFRQGQDEEEEFRKNLFKVSLLFSQDCLAIWKVLDFLWNRASTNRSQSEEIQDREGNIWILKY